MKRQSQEESNQQTLFNPTKHAPNRDPPPSKKFKLDRKSCLKKKGFGIKKTM